MTDAKKIFLATLGLVGGYVAYKGFANAPKYSPEWIRGLSDEEWTKERKIVQNQFRNPALGTECQEEWHFLLELFARVKRAKIREVATPQGPAYHREHGRNLYKPD